MITHIKGLIKYLAVVLAIGMLLLPSLVFAFSGDIGSVLDEQDVGGYASYGATMAQLSDDCFAVVTGNGYPNYRGSLWTFTISDIDVVPSDGWSFWQGYGSSIPYYPGRIIHLANDIVCWGGSGSYRTVAVDEETGTITEANIDTYDVPDHLYTWADIIHTSGNVYLLCSGISGNKLRCITTTISSSGYFSDIVIDQIDFGNGSYANPRLQYIGGNIYAITYKQGSNYLAVKTISVVGGLITELDIQTFTTDTMLSGNTYNCSPHTELVNVYGEIWAIGWCGDDPYYLNMRTIQIDDLTGDIYAVDEWLDCYQHEFIYPGICNIGLNDTSDGVILLFEGCNNDGNDDILTIEVSNTGIITEEIIDSLEFANYILTFDTIIEHQEERYISCGVATGSNLYAPLVGVDTTPVGGGDEEGGDEEEGDVDLIDNSETSDLMLMTLVPIAGFMGIVILGFAKKLTIAAMFAAMGFAVFAYIILYYFIGAFD